ncbi:hypothetical protein PLESTB_001966200 [Pleodorina starrii]|uniref:Uncharacterized protein n=1 Tax=Pleodorina starrii TaxID=330485 RepID=A0A9W6FB22_9CHLO|nr:hypothetical protein PLESTB_001966200 [Pleodorina starrii]
MQGLYNEGELMIQPAKRFMDSDICAVHDDECSIEVKGTLSTEEVRRVVANPQDVPDEERDHVFNIRMNIDGYGLYCLGKTPELRMIADWGATGAVIINHPAEFEKRLLCAVEQEFPGARSYFADVTYLDPYSPPSGIPNVATTKHFRTQPRMRPRSRVKLATALCVFMAQADADIIWGTSEQSMTAFLETYTSFSSDQVQPIYLRPAIIAVKAGNPKGITGFDDLLADGVKIVVTEGAGVGNTSGTGVWEDIAGRTGNLDDVVGMRRNIVAFEHGSGASFKAFTDMDADAWITWPDWTARNPDVIEAVSLSEDRAIWRDLNVAIAPDADPEAQAFLDFLVTDEAQALMETEGWTR